MYTNVANNSTNDGDDGGDGGLSLVEITGSVVGVISSIGVGVTVVCAIVQVVRWYLKYRRTRDNHPKFDAGDEPDNGNCFYN